MRTLLLLCLGGIIVAPVLADWDHPVKWDQLLPIDTFAGASWINGPANPGGTAQTADDFLCSGSPADRYITDIEFYGFSQFGSQYIDQFRVTFWDDVPANPNDASHPGNMLYEYNAPAADPGDPLRLGWQELEPEHFKIDIPEAQWFDQGLSQRVLWISIQGVMLEDGFSDAFYWYFRERHEPTWNDDAAFQSEFFGYAPWYNWGSPSGFSDPDLYDGPLPGGWTSLDMSFQLTGIPEPSALLLLGLGVLVVRRR
jgi:hypothetical protein